MIAKADEADRRREVITMIVSRPPVLITWKPCPGQE
jgi:hypothetical protein